MKGGNEGSEWASKREKQGNLLNAQRGAIVDGYELLAGEHKLIQVAPILAHLGAERCFFLVIALVERPQSLNQDSPVSWDLLCRRKRNTFFFKEVFLLPPGYYIHWKMKRQFKNYFVSIHTYKSVPPPHTQIKITLRNAKHRNIRMQDKHLKDWWVVHRKQKQKQQKKHTQFCICILGAKNNRYCTTVNTQWYGRIDFPPGMTDGLNNKIHQNREWNY